MLENRNFSFLNLFDGAFFISIDGPNGCGKTTVINELAECFKNAEIKFKLKEEPRPGGYVRTKIVEAKNPAQLSQMEIMKCFMKERDSNIKYRYIPQMLMGNHIICSRHLVSTHVYQGEFGDLGADVINEKYQKTLNNPFVRLCNFKGLSFQISLQLDLNTLLQRRNNRKANGQEATDNMEQSAKAEIAAYNKRYFPEQIFVDANGTSEQICLNIINAVRQEVMERIMSGKLR
ncbi:MAG: hypothetical protein LBD50_02225 [Rickettsiales bacterium]|jgi:thymidylate kinase|nr:hypothetical protein [Rickettsiales bacterium]